MLVRTIGKNHLLPWNKGLLVGQKKPLQPKHVWSIRVRLEVAHMWRDLALFNLAIDSKLRACDLVKRNMLWREDPGSSDSRSKEDGPTRAIRDNGADGCLPRGLVANDSNDRLSITLPEPASCTPSPIDSTIFPAGASLG
jgi:hypothetical protein